MLYMIGDRLKELRKQAGMSQGEFGAIAGTSKQYVGRLENGHNKQPGPELIGAWARHFQVRMEWITSGELPKEATGQGQSQPAGLDREKLSLAVRVANHLRDTYLTEMSDDTYVEVLAKAIQLCAERDAESLDLATATREVAARIRQGG